MPQKVSELVAELQRAGFVNRGGKGSHLNDYRLKGGRLRARLKVADRAACVR